MKLSYRQLAALFKALGEPNRLRIIAALTTRPACVCELAWALALKQPNLSRHLAVLAAAGLVETEREGLWVDYRLTRWAQAHPAVRMVRELARSDEKLKTDARALKRADRRAICETPRRRSKR